MSEENVLESSFKKDGSFQNENEPMKGDNCPKPSEPVFSSEGSAACENAEVSAEQVHAQKIKQSTEYAQAEEQNKPVLGSLEINIEADPSSEQERGSSTSANAEIPAEQVHVQENKQSTESAQPEEQTKAVLGSLENNTEANQSSEQQQCKSDSTIESKSLIKSGGVDQSVISSTSSEISPSQVPDSDKGLEGVADNIQQIYEGLKDMKISTQEIPESASVKKGRKPPTTPRARSTPVKPLTSPPLTRSRSRDLRKFPSTPSSPKRLDYRKISDSDSDDMKVVRGRQKMKRN